MQSTHTKISTVIAANIVGYRQLLAASTRADVKKLRELHEQFAAIVTEFGGREFGGAGATLIAEFPSVVNALRGTIALQQRLVERDETDAASNPCLRIGVHLGELVVDGGTLIGDGVDIACGLLPLAAAGEVVISSAVYEQVEGKVDAGFSYIGEQPIDKFSHPVKAYRLIAAGSGRSIRDIFSELRRRRVFRSAAAYVVAAWLLVQASDIILPVFNAPDWVLRSVVTLLGVGFPLAMLITWSVNLSTDGLVRTPDFGFSKRAGKWLKVAVVGSAAGISAVVLWIVWIGFLEPLEKQQVVARAPIKSQPVIVVAPMTKRVGDETIDWLGEGISNLIRDALADSPQTIVFSPAALHILREGMKSDITFAQAAKDAGADYLIAGDYMSTASGIVITTRIEDLDNGTIIPGERIEAANVEEAIAGTSRITRRVKQSLSLPYMEQVGHLAADFASSNLEAYELFVTGLEFLAVFDYDNSYQLLQAAVNAAPDFGMARFRLAQILESTGRNKEALEMLLAIETSRLSEREQLLIAGARYKFTENRDLAAAIDTYRKLVAKYPFDSEAHQNLAEAYWLDYQADDSIRQLQQLVELHPKEATSWMALGETQIDVGDIDGARFSIAEYVSMRPDEPYPHALLGELASREGQFVEASANYRKALAIQPSMGIAEIGLARAAYFDGRPDTGVERLRGMIANLKIQPDYRIDAAFDYANILHAHGRFREAHDVLLQVDAEIRDEGFREALALTVRALALVDLGDIGPARDLLWEAIEKTPASGQPTRQYFFLGTLGLRNNDDAEFSAALQSLRKLRINEDSTNDMIRDAAANYLEGLALLDIDPEAARERIQAAIDAPVFHYRLYEIGLAEAQAKKGDAATALTVLDEIDRLDPANPRLDLEYDRRLALLLRAEILEARNDVQAARDIARRFIAEWPNVPETHPAMRRALALLN